MRRLPALFTCFLFVSYLPLIVFAEPQEKNKSDCKSRITHSGFAEFVVPRDGGTHKLAIKVDPKVKWAVRNNAYIDWITILDGNSGLGPGTTTIQVETNSGNSCRVGELTIAGIDRIYGLPIRILQQGTEVVSEEKPEKPFLNVVDLAPFSENNTQKASKSEFRKVAKRP